MKKYDDKSKHWDNSPSTFIGFHVTKLEVLKGIQSAFSKLFTSILLHDTIYLRHPDYLSCFQLLGFDNTLKLLERGIIRVVYDFHDYTYSLIEGEYKLSYCMRLAPLEDLLNGYVSIKHKDKGIQARARYLTERNQVLLNKSNELKVDADVANIDKLPNSIIEEVNRDLSDYNFCNQFGISSKGFTAKKALTSLRICDILTGYALQQRLEVSAISQDSFSKDYANSKLFISNVKSETTDCFETIIKMKGVPNLYKLFTDGVIAFDDILKIREKYSAKTFRSWIEDKEYDQVEVTKELLKPCKSTITSKAISFVYPNVIGLINPVAGIIASATDSFFLNLISNKWNPKLFLDDDLSSFINGKISESEANELKQKRNMYTKLSSTDSCYCGSRKAFSRCHGK